MENTRARMNNFITNAKARGYKTNAAGEILNPDKAIISQFNRNFTTRRGDKPSLLGRLRDVNLNKSGTVGTESIGKFNRRGEFTKGTEFKMGKLGSVFVPNPVTLAKRYAGKVKKGVVKAITAPSRMRYGSKKVDEALKEIYK